MQCVPLMWAVIQTTTARCAGFPQGLLVTQDGFNSKPGLEDEYETQNFKVIDWRDVEALLAR